MISVSMILFRKILIDLKISRRIYQWVPPTGYDTGIQIYNRVVKQKVPLIFVNKNLVKWYICGPTVYDDSHIGHARLVWTLKFKFSNYFIYIGD